MFHHLDPRGDYREIKMKYAFVLAMVAAFGVSPAFAGGKGGSLIGGSVIPVTTGIGKISALNNVSVLSGNGIANGNKVNVAAPVRVSRNGIVGGLLGGLGHGCGCN